MSPKPPALAILLLTCLLLSLLTGASPIPTVLTPNESIDLRFRDVVARVAGSVYDAAPPPPAR